MMKPVGKVFWTKFFREVNFKKKGGAENNL